MKKVPFSAQIIAGLILGIGLGILARTAHIDWLSTTLATIGNLFIQLLKLAVVPLVFTAIVVSINNLRGINGGPKAVARLGGKTLLWFGITALISVGVGIATGLISNPGNGVALTATDYQPKAQGSWVDFLTGIIPKDLVSAFTPDNVLQVVFIAIVVGIASYLLADKAQPFVNFSRSLLEIVQKALWWVIRLAPIGTLGLIGKAASQYGFQLLAPLAIFAIAVYVGCLIVLLVVYPTLLRFVGKVNPIKFYRNAWPAIELAFVSRSSIGTMPLTQKVVTDNIGVPKEYASFAVPFAATTKMDGCAAVYPAIAAIFVAQVYGHPLGVTDFILIAFVSVIGSAATAGLTGAIVMLTLTLSTLGLPLAGVGIIIAIDPILDMMRTATNVTGQLVVPTLVSRSEGTLDDKVFNATNPDSINTKQPVAAAA